eukprot:augustus_masked-scaffold_7-processed-gene-9.54-mRNA-1 protein AED:0.05 eAED:0.05 QI:0/-1/0/1/-1/1/1/0/292
MSKKKRSPLVASLSGAFAGMVETTAIWPMENLKTQIQLSRSLQNQGGSLVAQHTMSSLAQETFKRSGVTGFYRGLLPVLLGSFPKAGVRFGGFNIISSKLRKEDGTITPLRSLFSGMCAGAVESTVAVTPIETIKTKLIDGNSGFVAGARRIIAKEGIKGVYQGWAATTLKQSSNQGLRFMAFGLYKEMLMKNFGVTNLSPLQSLLGGMCSGCFSTICNNPFDMIKTRMQGLEASKYRNFGDCFVQVLKEEGVFAFWKGTGARLMRVVPGQGIIFMSFETIAQNVEKLVENK